MEYQDLNSTLIEVNERKSFKEIFSKRNLIIGACVTFSLLLIASIGLNVYSMIGASTNKHNNERPSYEDQRVPIQPKEPKQNTTTIECQREFFLFHQDQNHVCEVTGILIKNDSNVTIVGNNLTNVLYIFNFEVYKIPKLLFINFVSLKNLIVNGNHMKVIENDTFESAENLEVLRLSNNDLTELQSLHFRYMKNLKTLDLGRNKIDKIESEAFEGLSNLERLYLSDNNLKSIPSDLFYPLRKLISLSLDNNQISFLNDDVFRYNKLIRSIGLSNNSFRVLQNELFHYFENLTDLSISELRIKSLDLNGTTVSTLVIRNTDLVNITLSNFPKILVSYGTNIEFIEFIVNEATADFNRIPNWGGMFYNKNIRFLFYVQKKIATRENVESYDCVVRKHIFLPDLDYVMSNGTKYLAVEYMARHD